MNAERTTGAPTARVAGITLGDVLGEGAVARVHAGRDGSGRDVAVKIAKRSRHDDPRGHERLLREARILERLDHPGIVRVFGVGETDDGHAYLVLERVDGRTLSDRIADGPIPPAEAWKIVRDAATALRHAHDAGVLHRDLTPSNVLVDGRGRVRLTDFGLARADADPQLTRDGEATGTPAYMAPEQWWGADLDERTDVYGLGAILFAALAGRPPWAGSDPGELLHRIATEEPERLSRAGAKVDADVDAFVVRCLRREPAGRPPDIETFVAEGDAAFRRRRRRSVAIVAAPLGAVAAAIAVGYQGSHSPLDWVLEAGWGGYAVLAVALLAAVGARSPTLRPTAPFLPLMLGGIATATGFGATMSGVYGMAAEGRFVIFHIGAAESLANLFMGGVLAAGIALGASWKGERPRLDVRTGVAAAVIVAAGVLAWNAAIAAVAVLALVLVLRGVPRRGVGGIAIAAACVGGAAIAAVVTTLADGAMLWNADLTRAERAIALTHHAAERTTVFGAIAAIGIAVVLSGRVRGRPRPGRGRWISATVFAALTTATIALPGAVMLGERDLLWEELAIRFALWRELDPPAGRTEQTARVGPTLQLGRSSVAVDGETIVPRASLETGAPTAALLIAEKLGPRLALGTGDGPSLVLAADRSLPFATVDRALDAARDLGVRQIDVLVAPGEPVRLPPGAPPEAAFVLPGDLSAIDVTLAPRSAVTERVGPSPEAPFGEVARALLDAENPTL